MQPLRTLSLFAGIGGFDLGLERTGGFKTVAFAEVDPFCQRVLAKHWPHVPNLGDVATAEFPDAQVICAGFPCQDVSKLGDRAGLAGANSGLWREVVRAIRVVRPDFVLLENVADLLIREVGEVAGDLATLGYDAEWDCVPARAVGAPHRRDRWFGVAYPARVGNRLSESALPSRWNEPEHSAWWAAEPDVRRVDDGIPDQSHRLRALGNAVVPQIPELIGRAILRTLTPHSPEQSNGRN